MAYATKADIIALHGDDHLKTVANVDDQGDIIDASVDHALTAASDEIDAYLAARYSVPLDPAPSVLKLHTVEIAMYRMAGAGYEETTAMKDRYDAAIDWLKGVAKGVNDVPGATSSNDSGSGDNGDIRDERSFPVFSTATMVRS